MNDLFDRTDEELVALYAEGNNGAFDVLLKRCLLYTSDAADEL